MLRCSVVRNLCVLLVALSCAGRALAQEGLDVPAEIALPHARAGATADAGELSAYCRYVGAVADSGSALLMSPWLFGNFGTILGGDSSQDATLGAHELKPRIQVGVGLSPTRMLRGVTTRELARAQCDSYAAEARSEFQNQALLRFDPRAGAPSAAALRAKIAVLDSAAEHGRKLLAELRRKLEVSLATVDEYGTLALKVDALERELEEAALGLSTLQGAPNIRDWARARREQARAEDAVERLESGLRKSQSFEIILRGGYDRVFGYDQKVPAFGMATLRFSPAWFFQGPAEARARSARRTLVERQNTAVLNELVPALRARLAADTRRLGAVKATLADLEARRKAVQLVRGEQAQRYAEFLWLELAELRAEQAYLEADSNELHTLLDEARRSAP